MQYLPHKQRRNYSETFPHLPAPGEKVTWDNALYSVHHCPSYHLGLNKHIIISHNMHSACGRHEDNLALDNRKPQSVDLATSTSEVATTLQEPIV